MGLALMMLTAQTGFVRFFLRLTIFCGDCETFDEIVRLL